MEANNNKIAYLIMLLASLLIAVIGGTYAFFTAGISQGETEATLKVGAGQLKIKFTNTNSIQITENVQPTPAKNECTKQTGAYYCNQSEYEPVGVKTFTLTGTNTTDASKNMKMLYNIKLIIPQNQFSSGALKYTLVGSKEANDNGKVVNIDTWQDIPTGSNTTGTVLGSGYFMPGENVVHTYTLNIYFPDNHISQDADKNKIFGGLIEVTNDEIKDSIPKGWYSASGGTLLEAIKSNNTLSKTITEPGSEISSDTEAVLASTEDDYGTSYYFRGAVNNNFVEYANMCWRIVRITGDGSIKLVLYNYNGLTSTNQTPSSNIPCSVKGDNIALARYEADSYTTKFNINYTDNAYVGFMYGTADSNNYTSSHTNINASTILINLNKWYTNVLSKQPGFSSSQLADTIWCNDKGAVTDATFNPDNLPLGTNYGYGNKQTYYNAIKRLVQASSWKAGGTGPSLICPNDNNGGKLSKFTVSDTEYGNGALSGYAKIGLLTADEMAFAGVVYKTTNSSYYLRQNANSNWWWTMSPLCFSGVPSVWDVSGVGFVSRGDVNIALGLRPALSLVSSTKVTGTGTATDPYKVQS
ncbi:MAG: hypothetical protein Q4C44_02325 [bacterium]|nr:hypothetical protein [bacterium]